MKILLLAPAAALLALAGGASAQAVGAPAAANAFTGFKVGATADYRRNQAKHAVLGQPQGIDKQAGGLGYRAYAGYDLALSDRWLVGAEAGLGGGGKALRRDGAAGDYRLKPGLSYDLSGRVGVLPTTSLLLYGRVGYQWLKTQEDVRSLALAPTHRKRTEGGLMYGFGAELAVSRQATLRAEFDQTDLGHGLKAAQVQLGGAMRF